MCAAHVSGKVKILNASLFNYINVSNPVFGTNIYITFVFFMLMLRKCLLGLPSVNISVIMITHMTITVFQNMQIFIDIHAEDSNFC